MRKKSIFKSITIITIILFFCLVYFFIKKFNFINDSQTQLTDSIIVENSKVFVNSNPINIKKILKENSEKSIREEMDYENVDLDYTTQYIDNEDLPSGTMHVTQLGIDGKQDVIIIRRFENDVLISEQIVASNVNKASIDKIVEIGTGKRINNYELKQGDIVYSTPVSLPVMQEANNDSEKLITITKGTRSRSTKCT
jgi:hypothetical protein